VAHASLLFGSAKAMGLEGRGMLQCNSDMYLGRVRNSSSKGITVDDTTLRFCAGRIPDLWPNSVSQIQTLRMFRAWAPHWGDDQREEAWDNLVSYASQNGVRFLMAAPVTCDKDADAQDWEWTKALMKRLGPKHVMGLAVGNELELLASSSPITCVQDIWDHGRLWDVFQRRVADIDEMGFSEVPITTVFTAQILYDGYPFTNIPGRVLANDFFANTTKKYGRRYTFTFNVYPYFDPSLKLDPESKHECGYAISKAACWGPHCLGVEAMKLARKRIEAFTKNSDDRMWIGEVGWSSPAAITLRPDMQACNDFSSVRTLAEFYQGFLKWDLEFQDMKGPDHIFYFTMRNALNFGVEESFGLIRNCEIDECKIKSENFTEFEALPPPIEARWLQLGFGVIAGSVAVMTALVALYVCASRGGPPPVRKPQKAATDSSGEDEEGVE